MPALQVPPAMDKTRVAGTEHVSVLTSTKPTMACLPASASALNLNVSARARMFNCWAHSACTVAKQRHCRGLHTPQRRPVRPRDRPRSGDGHRGHARRLHSRAQGLRRRGVQHCVAAQSWRWPQRQPALPRGIAGPCVNHKPACGASAQHSATCWCSGAQPAWCR